MTQRYVYLDSKPDGSPNFDEEGTVNGCASATMAGDCNVTVYIQDPIHCKDCGNTGQSEIVQRATPAGSVFCVLHRKVMIPEGYCHMAIPKLTPSFDNPWVEDSK